MKNYNEKHNEMRIEAIEKLIETIENGFNGYYCDLHNEAFNTDYYIIGREEAKRALKAYDVFEAIEVVQEYERVNFGEVYTNIADPEKLVNMLFYIIGDEIIGELYTACEEFSENWNEMASEETNEKLLECLKDYVIYNK